MRSQNPGSVLLLPTSQARGAVNSEELILKHLSNHRRHSRWCDLHFPDLSRSYMPIALDFVLAFPVGRRTRFDSLRVFQPLHCFGQLSALLRSLCRGETAVSTLDPCVIVFAFPDLIVIGKGLKALRCPSNGLVTCLRKRTDQRVPPFHSE